MFSFVAVFKSNRFAHPPAFAYNRSADWLMPPLCMAIFCTTTSTAPAYNGLSSSANRTMTSRAFYASAQGGSPYARRAPARSAPRGRRALPPQSAFANMPATLAGYYPTLSGQTFYNPSAPRLAASQTNAFVRRATSVPTRSVNVVRNYRVRR